MSLVLSVVKGFRMRGADGFSNRTPVTSRELPQTLSWLFPFRFTQCMLDLLNIRYEYEHSGLAPVGWCAALFAAGLSGEHGLYGGLGSVSEITGESESGSDRSGAVFAGGPGGVPSVSGLVVGRWSLDLGFSEHLDLQVTSTKQQRMIF